MLRAGMSVLLALAATFCVCIASGGFVIPSGSLEALLEEKLPRLSLLKKPLRVLPLLNDGDGDGFSGLPSRVVSFFRAPGFNISFIFVPGEIARDLLDFPEPVESTDKVESCRSKLAADSEARVSE